MFIILISYLLLINTIFFLKTKHPLTMGLTLMIQTTLICLMTGIISKTFWFSYILFLIFLGGMLILFIYMTAIASNEIFSFSFKSLIMPILTISLIYLSFMFFINFFTLNIKNMEMNTLNLNFNFIFENSLYLNKIYNFPSNIMTIILMNYLLLTLLVVVKITNIFYGPLRTLN